MRDIRSCHWKVQLSSQNKIGGGRTQTLQDGSGLRARGESRSRLADAGGGAMLKRRGAHFRARVPVARRSTMSRPRARSRGPGTHGWWCVLLPPKRDSTMEATRRELQTLYEQYAPAKLDADPNLIDGEQRAIDVESRKKAIGHKRKAKRRVECLHFENYPATFLFDSDTAVE